MYSILSCMVFLKRYGTTKRICWSNLSRFMYVDCTNLFIVSNRHDVNGFYVSVKNYWSLFCASFVDYSLFMFHTSTPIIFILDYVDGVIMTWSHEHGIFSIIDKINGNFIIKDLMPLSISWAFNHLETLLVLSHSSILKPYWSWLMTGKIDF